MNCTMLSTTLLPLCSKKLWRVCVYRTSSASFGPFVCTQGTFHLFIHCRNTSSIPFSFSKHDYVLLLAFLPIANLNKFCISCLFLVEREAHWSHVTPIADWLQSQLTPEGNTDDHSRMFLCRYFLWMFTESVGMYSISLWISLVNGVALPLTLCDKSLNNESMEMECGDKCVTCRESETFSWETFAAEDMPLSFCFTCWQSNYFILFCFFFFFTKEDLL